MSLTELSAVDAAREIREGRLKSVDLVRACLDRIEATDADIGAWAHLDAERALLRAGEMDAARQAGRALGRLHGLPVGLKDIVDTSDFPTERGSPIFAGRRPERDAFIVDQLHLEGAVILGKTVTTEFAFLHPARTRNPHDPARTPGGSSSGSAAAVASHQVPLAVGTQTNGSVIRPAAFCGVFGLKPTRGLIPRTGVLETSRSLDQIGAFGRSVADAALLVDAMTGHDGADPLSLPRPRPRLSDGAGAQAPVPPTIAWFDLPYADRVAADAREGLEAVAESLGTAIERLEAPARFADMLPAHNIIHKYEICQHLDPVFRENWEALSPSLQPVIEEGRAIAKEDYLAACDLMRSAVGFFAAFFRDYDAILAPSALGEAPLIADGGTGDPVCSTIWTLAGLPCLTLPVLVGEAGLPVGVQLIGGAEEDDRLCRTAGWLLGQLDETQ